MVAIAFSLLLVEPKDRLILIPPRGSTYTVATWSGAITTRDFKKLPMPLVVQFLSLQCEKS